MKIILDANFLLIPSQFKVDIFTGLMNLLNQRFDPVLLSTTYQELLRLAEQASPKLRKNASLALRLVKKCRLIHVKRGLTETPDDVIVRLAKEWKCPVATNDVILRKRLRKENVPTIFLRQRAYLEAEGLSSAL